MVDNQNWTRTKDFIGNCLFVWQYYYYCLNSLYTGGRDKRGGPILTFPARSNHDRIKQEDLRRLVTYLSTVPRYKSSYNTTYPWLFYFKCTVRVYSFTTHPLLHLTFSLRSGSPCHLVNKTSWNMKKKRWSGGWSACGVLRSCPHRKIKRLFLLHHSGT